MRTLALVPALALVVVSATACGPNHDPEACTGAQVTRGLGLSWRDLNHRISFWKVSKRPLDSCAATDLSAGYIGGEWTTGQAFDDRGQVYYGFQTATAPAEELGAHRVTIPLSIPPPGRVSGTLVLDRAEAQLEGYPEIVPLVDGLELYTDVPQEADYPSDYSPADGYTSRGIGVDLALGEVTSETITIEWSVRFEHGMSDRQNMNGAVPYAKTAGNLDIMVLGVAKAEVLKGSVDYLLEYDDPPALQEQTIAPATPEQQRVSLSGKAGGGAGIAGWTRFDFLLDALELDDGGYYIRDLRAAIENESYDDTTGKATFLLNGYASNSSLLAFHAMRNHFTGQMAWIQVGAGAPEVLEGDFAAGEATLSLGDAVAQ